MINYDGKLFRPISNTENGETSEETLFNYQQNGEILTCTYRGGAIITGHLIGLVNELGEINMRYHQINSKGEIMTGICHSKPQVLENGKIRLLESWKWTCKDFSEGNSILEEI